MTDKRDSMDDRPRILVVEGLSGGSSVIRQAGAVPIEVGTHQIDRALDAIGDRAMDGVLLTGGGDVDPRLYGQMPNKSVYGVSEERDALESLIIGEADKLGIPILGICRGSQILNVVHGGTLIQHLPAVTEQRHTGTEHTIRTRKGSVLRDACGARGQWVISLHHQAVARPGKDMIVTAWAGDNTVEAVESIDGRIVGVQFHPEMAVDTGDPGARALFEWLVDEAAARANLPTPDHSWDEPHWSTTPSYRNWTWEGDDHGRVIESTVNGEWEFVRYLDGTSEMRRIPQPVKIYRICAQCQIEFDERADYYDHMLDLHDIDLLRGEDAMVAEERAEEEREQYAREARRQEVAEALEIDVEEVIG